MPPKIILETLTKELSLNSNQTNQLIKNENNGRGFALFPCLSKSTTPRHRSSQLHWLRLALQLMLVLRCREERQGIGKCNWAYVIARYIKGERQRFRSEINNNANSLFGLLHIREKILESSLLSWQEFPKATSSYASSLLCRKNLKYIGVVSFNGNGKMGQLQLIGR